MTRKQSRLRLLVLISCLLGFMGLASETIFRPGDHVAIVGNVFADQMRRHGYFETRIRTQLPKYDLKFRILGWAGDTLTQRFRPDNFASEGETLRTFGADIILICFGLGDALDGEVEQLVFRDELVKLIQQYSNSKYNGRSAPRLVLVSPTAYEDLRSHSADQDSLNKKLKKSTRVMRQVADERKLPFVDLYTPTKALMEERDGSRLTTNGLLLSNYGYWAVSHFLTEALLRNSKSINLVLGESSSSYPEMTRFQRLGNRFAWETAGTIWTLPAPPGSRVHASLTSRQDRVRAPGLVSGIYTLTVNGRVMARGTHAEWAEGLTFSASALSESMDELRESTVDKNAQFFYAWRALNQVHIVGERRKSPSGRALPAELVQFYKLTERKEEQLNQTISKYPNAVWELKREQD